MLAYSVHWGKYPWDKNKQKNYIILFLLGQIYSLGQLAPGTDSVCSEHTLMHH